MQNGKNATSQMPKIPLMPQQKIWQNVNISPKR